MVSAIVIAGFAFVAFASLVYVVPNRTARIALVSIGVFVVSYLGWIVAVADQDDFTLWIGLTSAGGIASLLILGGLVLRGLGIGHGKR
jgi:hypothetical protein